MLIIHRNEDRKPTNTGRLATECLVNSQVMVRGIEDVPTEDLVFEPNAQPLLLFPHENARPITDYVHSTKPITLVVPDGTWRQAFKVRQRVPPLSEVQCVTLPPALPSIYRLRSEPMEHGLATIEAIARAMGILEGDHVQRAIEGVFRTMVDRTLWSRGSIAAKDVTGAIPDGAERHDPTSGATGAPYVKKKTER